MPFGPFVFGKENGFKFASTNKRKNWKHEARKGSLKDITNVQASIRITGGRKRS